MSITPIAANGLIAPFRPRPHFRWVGPQQFRSATSPLFVARLIWNFACGFMSMTWKVLEGQISPVRPRVQGAGRLHFGGATAPLFFGPSVGLVMLSWPWTTVGAIIRDAGPLACISKSWHRWMGWSISNRWNGRMDCSLVLVIVDRHLRTPTGFNHTIRVLKLGFRWTGPAFAESPLP